MAMLLRKTVIVSGLLWTMAASAQADIGFSKPDRPPHEFFMNLSPKGQRELLETMVAYYAEYCPIAEHEFKGLYNGSSYYLVTCQAGAGYLVAIKTDAKGDVTVMDCGIGKTGVDSLHRMVTELCHVSKKTPRW